MRAELRFKVREAALRELDVAALLA